MRHDARRSLTAILVGSLVALAPVLAPSAGAAAPGYPVDICATISVSTTTPRVGEAIDVTGVNFLPDKDVDLVLKPAPGNTKSTEPSFDLKTVRSDANGSFSTQVVMPDATTSKGEFVLSATSGAPGGTSCPADPSVALTLSADGGSDNNGPNGGPDETAFTGLNVLLLLLLAAALIAVGIAATRRGRTAPTSIR